MLRPLPTLTPTLALTLALTGSLAAATPRDTLVMQVNSATARNGSRASGDAASTLPPRPLAKRNPPLPPPRSDVPPA